MSQSANHVLALLSQTDARILFVAGRKNQIDQQLSSVAAQVADGKKRLMSQEAASKDGKQRQMLEEHRLKEEQDRIVERRKQLTALGAKAAKLMEREIDIASRAVEGLESKALQAIEESDRLDISVGTLREGVDTLQHEFERLTSELNPELEQIGEELNRLRTERDGLLGQLDEKARTLYTRVSARYPGSAIAVAEGGSCKACFRALPPQTYNQILAGTVLIQCPGCNRILSRAETPPAAG